MLGSRCPIGSLHWPRPRLPHPHSFQVDKFETDVFTPGAHLIRVSFVLFGRLVHLLLSFPASVFSFLSNAFLKTSVSLPECQWNKTEQACAKHFRKFQTTEGNSSVQSSRRFGFFSSTSKTVNRVFWVFSTQDLLWFTFTYRKTD